MRFDAKSGSVPGRNMLQPMVRCADNNTPETSEFSGYCERQRLGMRVECNVEVVIWLICVQATEKHRDGFCPGSVPVRRRHSLSIVSVPAGFAAGEVSFAKYGVIATQCDELLNKG